MRLVKPKQKRNAIMLIFEIRHQRNSRIKKITTVKKKKNQQTNGEFQSATDIHFNSSLSPFEKSAKQINNEEFLLFDIEICYINKHWITCSTSKFRPSKNISVM